MSLEDFRRLIDVAPDAYVAVQVTDPNEHAPVQLEVRVADFGLTMRLDEGTAGLLFDTLAAALTVVVTGRAQHTLEGDTPGGAAPVSDGSASIHDRG